MLLPRNTTGVHPRQSAAKDAGNSLVISSREIISRVHQNTHSYSTNPVLSAVHNGLFETMRERNYDSLVFHDNANHFLMPFLQLFLFKLDHALFSAIPSPSSQLIQKCFPSPDMSHACL